MTNHFSLKSIVLLLLLIILKFNNTCFNHLNYLFLNDMSLINIPLLPRDCFDCQKAYQVDIQLIDEQYSINRTIQRIKINLKNFEIEDSSYICLISDCPIVVEYGNDQIQLNITSKLFSHVFLLLNYFQNSNQTILCSIQTRFSIFLFNKSFTCTNEVYVHPRFHIEIIGQMKFDDCQGYVFEKIIYEKSIKFQQINFQIDRQRFRMKSIENSCEYILEHTSYVKNSSIQINEFLTKITVFPYFNPWDKDIQVLGPCRTKIIPYKEMIYTENVVNIRNIFIEKGQTIEIECPIDGSKKYLKYTWYYQRYQPKYQISNNRTIILKNITEYIQGKYMCIGDDQYEKLEFEMTLHLLNHNKTNNNNNNSFYWILMLIILIILILFCSILTFIIYISLKKFSHQISNSRNCLIEKPNTLTIHHDVMLTIQHLSDQQQSKNCLWNQPPYQTLDYIDEQSIYPLPSNQLIQQIPYQYSTHHRNLNRQFSVNSPLIQSHSDITYSPIVKFNKILNDEKPNDIEILKISVPLLTEYPIRKSSSSIISFDSQNELDQFNQMTSVCINDNE